ncbi:MAG: hypothetical protein ACE5OO_03695 [Candidatus Bathyarchaeia archaeon]
MSPVVEGGRGSEEAGGVRCFVRNVAADRRVGVVRIRGPSGVVLNRVRRRRGRTWA